MAPECNPRLQRDAVLNRGCAVTGIILNWHCQNSGFSYKCQYCENLHWSALHLFMIPPGATGMKYNDVLRACIVDGTIATLYFEGVSLNTRMQAKPGDALALYVVDVSLTVDRAVLATGLRLAA